MPQMAPYNWLSLFIMFTFIYSYLLSYLYFLNFKNFKMSKNSKMKNNFYWMW